jgi:CubicO group peptidase (beta-lactamase class C family)
MMGSVGHFSWPGASGTDWWVDPKEELAVVYLSAAPALPAEDQRDGVSVHHRVVSMEPTRCSAQANHY